MQATCTGDLKGLGMGPNSKGSTWVSSLHGRWVGNR